MSLFVNLTNDGLEESQDRLGGFSLFDTDIYEATIKLAYGGQAESGAAFVAYVFELPGGKEYKETVYVTNKKGENFFMNPQDKTKKVPLPGFTIADDLALLASDKPLAEMETQEKVINLYDFEAKKEVPTKVQMLVDLLGKKVGLGIQKKLENKQAKNPSTNVYEPTAEERETNNIEKVFHLETKLTVAEARLGKEAGEFWGSWLERNKGKVRDARKLKPGGAAIARPGKPGVAAPSASTTPARKSLFGNK